MKFVVLFLVTVILDKTAGSREKRLVLHSDTDIATEVLKLRTEIENQKSALAAEVATLKTQLQNQNTTIGAELLRQHDTLTAKHENITVKLQAEIASLTASNNKINHELSNLQLAFNTEVTHDHGSVYVRWGRTVCPGNGSALVYKGYMAGSEYTQKGNGANNLCLPENPTWAKYTDANEGARANIYGAEFEGIASDVFFGKHVQDQDVPCAVCQTPGVSVMIPARTNCYPGWKLEYSGYLMADRSEYSSSEYVCVDADPEFVPRGHASTNGHIIYLVQSMCGTLVCPPYYDYRELACCVCSK